MHGPSILASALSAAILAMPIGDSRGSSAAQNEGSRPAATAASLNGQWFYNRGMSFDLATRRPELGEPGRTRDATALAPGAPDAAVTMSSLFAAERRALFRDLLEVPLRLTLRLTDEGMRVTDDLDRERVYPIGNRRAKFQLGAARFEASMQWDGVRLRKDIEGPAGFKMTETYFLGEAGDRLLVVLRVGDPSRDELLAGRNRVYDRGARAR
jgi:hypothetical protein